MNLIGSRIRPYVPLIPVCVGVFIAADDQTVIVTVLPSIIVDFGILPTNLDKAAWTITGYLLGYLVAMPLIGRLSDSLGHRKLFTASMIIFGIGSAAVALAPELSWLITARVFQSIGAGAMIPISIAIAGDILPSGKRGPAYGLIGASAEAGGVLGPLWGGLVTKFLDWPWVFWLNIPLGLVVLIMIRLMLAPSKGSKTRVDYLGGLLIAITLTSLTLALDRISSPDLILGGYVIAFVISTALFIVRGNLIDSPLIAISAFKNTAFASANIAHILIGAALITGMVTIPLMANTTMSLSPLEGGLRLLRLTAAIPIGAIIGGFACVYFEYRLPAITGLLLASLGFMFMSGWDITIGEPLLTIQLAITGLGFGLLIEPITLAVTESVIDRDRGTAASIVTASRTTGMTLGLAALTAWGAARFENIAPAAAWPFQLHEETAVDLQNRLSDYDSLLTEAAMTVFKEFFIIATFLCLSALIPCVLFKWRKKR